MSSAFIRDIVGPVSGLPALSIGVTVIAGGTPVPISYIDTYNTVKTGPLRYDCPGVLWHRYAGDMGSGRTLFSNAFGMGEPAGAGGTQAPSKNIIPIDSDGDIVRTQEIRVRKCLVRIRVFFDDRKHSSSARDGALTLNHLLDQLTKLKRPLTEGMIEDLESCEELVGKWDDEKNGAVSGRITGAASQPGDTDDGMQPVVEEPVKTRPPVPSHVAVGSRIYHRHHGTVMITGIEHRPEGLFITFKPTIKDQIGELYDPDVHLIYASEEVPHLIEKEATERYTHFPLVAAIAYLASNFERYETILERIYGIEGFRVRKLIRTIMHVSANYLAMKPRKGYVVGRELPCSPALRDKYGSYFHSSTRGFDAGLHILYLALAIHRETGDDMIELGLGYFSGDMRSLVRTLSSRGGSYARRSDKTRMYMFRFNISDDVMQYFTRRMGDYRIATWLDPLETGHEGRIFSAGDYDVDHAAYLALRDNDEVARSRWADSMSALIRDNPALADASLLVPIPGREGLGMPVNALAETIGGTLNIPVAVDIFRPRPDGRLPTEAKQSLQDKERQAVRNYKLRGEGTKYDSAVIRAVRGKKVVIIDDCYSSGAAYRAVAAELRNAGAREVYIVTAVRNNR